MDKVIDNDIKRCITCKHKPCQNACPAGIDIPNMIYALKENDLIKAREIIMESSNLSTICSRVCPHDKQCIGHCTLGIKKTPINIGAIESMVSDQLIEEEFFNCDDNIDKVVSIIGAGPAGISAAKDLLKKGYRLKIYDAHEKLGGVIRYGIPNFRINDEIIDKEIKSVVENKNVELHLSCVVGKDISINEIVDNSDAVIVAVGLNKPKYLGIENETNIEGVITSDKFLAFANGYYEDAPFKKYFEDKQTKVLVVGGGDVAMDSARASKELGLENVEIVYRRDFEQMPANLDELMDTKDNYKVKFNNLCNPVSLITNDNKLNAIECVKMELVDDEKGGRKRPMPIENSNFNMDCDILILSLGMDMSDSAKKLFLDLGIKVDWKLEDIVTTNKKVFVAGDIKEGNQTVVKAMVDGKKAAQAVCDFMKNKN